VPLTGSLYVPGRLVASSSSSEEEEEEGTAKVVVDVGTGFFVEKVRFPPLIPSSLVQPTNEQHRQYLTFCIRGGQTPDQARHFYKQKVEELGKNLLDLEAIVQGKQGTLRVVEDGEGFSIRFASVLPYFSHGLYRAHVMNSANPGVLREENR